MLSDTEFRQRLDYLDRLWAGFRKVRKGVKKRIRRHMVALGCPTVDAYLSELAYQPGAQAACEQCLRVTISRFFRDKALWQALRIRILPECSYRIDRDDGCPLIHRLAKRSQAS